MFSNPMFSPLKRFYKFVLKRLIGNFLSDELDIRQLDVQLSSGIVQLRDLKLRLDVLNEMMEGTPLRFTDARIELVHATIPWRNPLQLPCRLKLDGLKLTATLVADTRTKNSRLGKSSILQEAVNEVDAQELSRSIALHNKLVESIAQGEAIDDDDGGTDDDVDDEAEEERHTAQIRAKFGQQQQKQQPQEQSSAETADGMKVVASFLEQVISQIEVEVTNFEFRLEQVASDGKKLLVFVVQVPSFIFGNADDGKKQKPSATTTHTPSYDYNKFIRLRGIHVQLFEKDLPQRGDGGVDSIVASVDDVSARPVWRKQPDPIRIPTIMHTSTDQDASITLRVGIPRYSGAPRITANCFFHSLRLALTPRDIVLLGDLMTAFSIASSASAATYSSNAVGALSPTSSPSKDEEVAIWSVSLQIATFAATILHENPSILTSPRSGESVSGSNFGGLGFPQDWWLSPSDPVHIATTINDQAVQSSTTSSSSSSSSSSSAGEGQRFGEALIPSLIDNHFVVIGSNLVLNSAQGQSERSFELSIANIVLYEYLRTELNENNNFKTSQGFDRFVVLTFDHGSSSNEHLRQTKEQTNNNNVQKKKNKIKKQKSMPRRVHFSSDSDNDPDDDVNDNDDSNVQTAFERSTASMSRPAVQVMIRTFSLSSSSSSSSSAPQNQEKIQTKVTIQPLSVRLDVSLIQRTATLVQAFTTPLPTSTTQNKEGLSDSTFGSLADSLSQVRFATHANDNAPRHSSSKTALEVIEDIEQLTRQRSSGDSNGNNNNNTTRKPSDGEPELDFVLVAATLKVVFPLISANNATNLRKMRSEFLSIHLTELRMCPPVDPAKPDDIVLSFATLNLRLHTPTIETLHNDQLPHPILTVGATASSTNISDNSTITIRTITIENQDLFQSQMYSNDGEDPYAAPLRWWEPVESADYRTLDDREVDEEQHRLRAKEFKLKCGARSKAIVTVRCTGATIVDLSKPQMELLMALAEDLSAIQTQPPNTTTSSTKPTINFEPASGSDTEDDDESEHKNNEYPSGSELGSESNQDPSGSESDGEAIEHRERVREIFTKASQTAHNSQFFPKSDGAIAMSMSRKGSRNNLKGPTLSTLFPRQMSRELSICSLFFSAESGQINLRERTRTSSHYLPDDNDDDFVKFNVDDDQESIAQREVVVDDAQPAVTSGYNFQLNFTQLDAFAVLGYEGSQDVISSVDVSDLLFSEVQASQKGSKTEETDSQTLRPLVYRASSAAASSSAPLPCLSVNVSIKHSIVDPTLQDIGVSLTLRDLLLSLPTLDPTGIIKITEQLSDYFLIPSNPAPKHNNDDNANVNHENQDDQIPQGKDKEVKYGDGSYSKRAGASLIEKILTKLRIRLLDCAVDYNPTDHPARLMLQLDSVSLSTSFLSQYPIPSPPPPTKFTMEFRDLSGWLLDKSLEKPQLIPQSEPSIIWSELKDAGFLRVLVHQDSANTMGLFDTLEVMGFVRIASVNLLEILFVESYAFDPLSSVSSKSGTSPLITTTNIELSNEDCMLLLCSDSLAVLLSLAQHASSTMTGSAPSTTRALEGVKSSQNVKEKSDIHSSEEVTVLLAAAAGLSLSPGDLSRSASGDDVVVKVRNAIASEIPQPKGNAENDDNQVSVSVKRIDNALVLEHYAPPAAGDNGDDGSGVFGRRSGMAMAFPEETARWYTREELQRNVSSDSERSRSLISRTIASTTSSGGNSRISKQEDMSESVEGNLQSANAVRVVVIEDHITAPDRVQRRQLIRDYMKPPWNDSSPNRSGTFSRNPHTLALSVFDASLTCRLFAGSDYSLSSSPSSSSPASSSSSSSSSTQAPSKSSPRSSSSGQVSRHQYSQGASLSPGKHKTDPITGLATVDMDDSKKNKPQDTKNNNNISPKNSNRGRISTRRTDLVMDIVVSDINARIDTSAASPTSPTISEATTNNDESEISARVFLCIGDIAIKDRIPSSSFSYFLSRERDLSGGSDLKDSFIGSEGASHNNVRDSLVRFVLTTVRPDRRRPQWVEHRVTSSVEPLRLTVDQDALDFFIQFGNGVSTASTSLPQPVSAGPPSTPSGSQQPSEEYIQSFLFKGTRLSVDYTPKRIDFAALQQGDVSQLAHLFPIENLDIDLKPIDRFGVSGWDRLFGGIVLEWGTDIAKNQAHRYLGGIQPIRSMVNVGASVLDLVLLPAQQYKQHGQIVRGLSGVSRAAKTVLKTVASETINVGNSIAVGAHSLLKNVDKVVNPSSEGSPHTQSYSSVTSLRSPKKQARKSPMTKSKQRQASSSSSSSGSAGGGPSAAFVGSASNMNAREPATYMEGLEQAKHVLTVALNSAVRGVVAVPLGELSRLGATSAVRAVVLGVPTAVLHPMMGAAEAASKALLGLRNTVDPNKAKKQRAKFKRNNPH